jgi:uncharacterized membrane protein YfcA
MPMPGDFSVAIIACSAVVIFAAFIVRGMSGFGAGLVATPLLSFMMPVHVVVPATGLLVFVLFVFLFIRDWREVEWPELRRLVVPTVLGVVAGLFLFRSLDNRWLLTLLGAFLLVYATYMLLVHAFGMPAFRCSERWAFPLGLGGSFIDTLFGGGGGTLVVIYMHARGFSGMRFRATLAVLWFVEMVARIGGYAWAGYYTANALLLVALMLPMMAAGTWVGERIGNRISQTVFSRFLAVLLLASGAALLAR